MAVKATFVLHGLCTKFNRLFLEKARLFSAKPRIMFDEILRNRKGIEMKRKLFPLFLAAVVAVSTVGTTFASAATEGKYTAACSPVRVAERLHEGGIETVKLTKTEQKIKNELLTYLTSLEKNRNFSGQVLVERNGRVLVDRSYGYGDYEKKVKATNVMSFSVGSVTKQFTAAAIVQLQEQGKLSYEDKVSKYLNNVPFGDKITIQQLLTHTSGLKNFNENPDFGKLKLSDMTFDKLIALVSEEPLNFEPGTDWSYSNTGYLVLGTVVEKISGESLEIYLEKNIFKPAGLEHTSASYRKEQKVVDAKGYVGYLEVVPDETDAIELNGALGAGYLCSTAEDLYKWDLALQSGKIVSKESLAKVFGKYGDTKRMGFYGYGWFIQKGSVGEEISHGGNTSGFTSLNSIYTEKNAHVILITNKAYAGLAGINRNIVDGLAGKKLAPLKAWGSYKLSQKQMDGVTGLYKGTDYTASITNENGRLMLNISGAMSCELTADTKNSLYSKQADVVVKTVTDKTGKASEIRISIGGRAMDYKRSEEKTYVTLSGDQMKKYVGTYEIKGLFKMNLSIENEKLMLQAEGQPAIEIKAISEIEFEAASVGATIKFDSKEDPKAFVLKQAGQEFNAVRIK